VHYGYLERLIANSLWRFPRAKSATKTAYQRTVYLLHALARTNRTVVCPEVTIKEVSLGDRTESGIDANWFGYYDRSPWSSAGSLYITHRIGRHGNRCQIVVTDLRNNSASMIGVTASWNFQQGAMSSWDKASPCTVVYNTVEGGILGSRWVTLSSNSVTATNSQFIPWPIQALHPKEGAALTLNYRRLHRLRPEYGYSTHVTNFYEDQQDESDGIWRLNVATATARLVVSIQQLRLWQTKTTMIGADHKVRCIPQMGHILFSCIVGYTKPASIRG